MLSLTPRTHHHRFSEAAFRRFEPTLIAIVEAWPNPTCALPGVLSIETFTHRFRDAMNGFLMGGWDSVVKPDDVRKIFKFAGAGGTFIVSSAKGTDGLVRVYFGPPAELGVVLSDSLEPAKLVAKGGESLLNALQHPEVVRAFALLKNHELVSGVVTFTDLTEELETELRETYPNIEFQKAGNNQTQMY